MRTPPEQWTEQTETRSVCHVATKVIVKAIRYDATKGQKILKNKLIEPGMEEFFLVHSQLAHPRCRSLPIDRTNAIL